MVSYPETSIDHLDLLLQVASTQNITSSTAAWLAQLGECRSAEWEVTGSNSNTQGLSLRTTDVSPGSSLLRDVSRGGTSATQ